MFLIRVLETYVHNQEYADFVAIILCHVNIILDTSETGGGSEKISSAKEEM
jgi:hypothetical protein